MEELSNPNRRRMFDDKGRRIPPMHMDGASARNIPSLRQKRAEDLKAAKEKKAKRRKRNR